MEVAETDMEGRWLKGVTLRAKVCREFCDELVVVQYIDTLVHRCLDDQDVLGMRYLGLLAAKQSSPSTGRAVPILLHREKARNIVRVVRSSSNIA